MKMCASLHECQEELIKENEKLKREINLYKKQLQNLKELYEMLMDVAFPADEEGEEI